MSMTIGLRLAYTKTMKQRKTRPQPRRDLLVKTAYRLFNAQGYHATGIDQILAESGVAKATLYKYFSSN